MRKAGQGNILARLKILVLKVFSNDFATVDFREGLCYHSRPKKQNSEGKSIIRKNRKHGKVRNRKAQKESASGGEERQPIPSGSAGTAPLPAALFVVRRGEVVLSLLREGIGRLRG